MPRPLSARRIKSNRRLRSQHLLGRPTIYSNSSKSGAGYRCRATSGAVTSKTESGVFHEVIIGSMMSIPRDEVAGAMPSESSSSNEPEKPTIPETTTEPLSLLTNVQSANSSMAGDPTLQAHLCNATPPWSTLLVIPRGTSASALVKTPPGFALRIIRGKKCRTPSGLFGEFARALAFPDYFGHNWDALEECLADLEWLPAKGYILLITDTQAVLPGEEEHETLLEVLDDAGEAWSKGHTADGRQAPFHAVFIIAEQDKSKRKHWELEEFFSPDSKKPKMKPLPKRSPKQSRK